MRRTLSFVAKVAISALLLFVAVRWVNFGLVRDRLRQINLLWFLLAFFALGLQSLIAAIRWRAIVECCGKPLPVKLAVRYVMVANFFNQTLPSSVGGDAARIIFLARRGAGWAASAYSVILDRVFGVFALALLVVVCLPWSLLLIRDPIGRAGLLLIGFGCLTASFLFFALGSKPLTFLKRWTPTRHLAAAAAVGLKIIASKDAFRVIALSIVIHLFTVAVAWCAAKAIHAPLTPTAALFLVLPVILITIVPISIAGWGIRESAMIVAFAYAGLPDTEGLLVSLLFGIATFLLGAIGGLIWIFTGERHERHVFAAVRSDE